MSPGLLTAALVGACLLLFSISLWSAWVLAGRRSALGFAALALGLGWFAEQMGSSQGWFFGRYHYTTVLWPELGNVPVAIALLSGSTQYEIPWGNIMAASVIVTVPLVVLVLIFQRKIVSGLTAGGVKG